jgi:hypothetical protein
LVFLGLEFDLTFEHIRSKFWPTFLAEGEDDAKGELGNSLVILSGDRQAELFDNELLNKELSKLGMPHWQQIHDTLLLSAMFWYTTEFISMHSA